MFYILYFVITIFFSWLLLYLYSTISFNKCLRCDSHFVEKYIICYSYIKGENKIIRFEEKRKVCKKCGYSKLIKRKTRIVEDYVYVKPPI